MRHPPPSKRRKYTLQDKERATESVESIGLRKTAKLLKIPKSTISKWLSKEQLFHGGSGSNTVLKLWEDSIVTIIESFVDMGKPIGQRKLRTLSNPMSAMLV